MVNFYRLTALFAVFFTSFFVLANNPNPTGSPDDELFDYAFGLAQKEENQLQWYCSVSDGAFWTSSGEACVSAACSYVMANVPDGKSHENCRSDLMNYGDNNHLQASYAYDSWSISTSSGAKYNKQIKGGMLINTQGTVNTSYTCPPDGYSSYSLSANVGESPLCFDPLDLASRDSCEPNGTTPEFLPQSGQGASVCMTQPDGSQCDTCWR